MPKSVVIDDAFAGRATGRRGSRSPTRSSTRPTSRASRCATRTSARTFAAPTPGWPPMPAIAYLKDLGVTAVELLPVHHISDESFLAERGLRNYWGYSTIGYFAPHSEYAATGAPRRAGAGVQGDGQGAAPRRHRGDPRRRLQPHRRGQPPRADAVVQGRRQPLLLPPVARRPAPLHGLHRHRQLAEPGTPERAAADHGLAALLGDRVPRGRLPLRPRVARWPASSSTSTGCRRSST